MPSAVPDQQSVMNFHRYYYPEQIVFITQVVKDRHLIFQNQENVKLLRETLHIVQEKHNFKMLAYVFLPDHFHLLIQPKGNSNFSQIMHSLKFRFTRAYKQKMGLSEHLNFWQKRFWDHIIRDENDLENHIHYIHYNPIKHGYVHWPTEWKNSSYQEWVKIGAYEEVKEWEEPQALEWGE